MAERHPGPQEVSPWSQVIAREEGRTAKVYTISLLLLVITWSPFYIMSMVQLVTSDLSTSLSLSPLVTSLATLYAPLAALLHGYRQPAVSTLKYFQSDVKFEIFLQV